MIFKKRFYLIGGSSNAIYKKGLTSETSWFGLKCLRFCDAVISMLAYMQKLEIDKAQDLLEYIVDSHNGHKLPEPKEEGATTDHEILRIYYIIKTSIRKNKDAASYLLSKIKVEGKFVNIKDFDGKGDIG